MTKQENSEPIVAPDNSDRSQPSSSKNKQNENEVVDNSERSQSSPSENNHEIEEKEEILHWKETIRYEFDLSDLRLNVFAQKCAKQLLEKNLETARTKDFFILLFGFCRGEVFEPKILDLVFETTSIPLC